MLGVHDYHGSDLLEHPAELEGGPVTGSQPAEEDSVEPDTANEPLSTEVSFFIHTALKRPNSDSPFL